jgi:hypothetical protein
MAPRLILRDVICFAIGDAGTYMLALLRLHSVRRTRRARRNDIAFEPFAIQNERWRALVLFDGGQSLADKLPQIPQKLRVLVVRAKKGCPDWRASRSHLLRSHQITSAAGSCC